MNILVEAYRAGEGIGGHLQHPAPFSRLSDVSWKVIEVSLGLGGETGCQGHEVRMERRLQGVLQLVLRRCGWRGPSVPVAASDLLAETVLAPEHRLQVEIVEPVSFGDLCVEEGAAQEGYALHLKVLPVHGLRYRIKRGN